MTIAKSLVAAALAAALVLGTATVAEAANTRVIIAGPEGDPIAARLQKELTAMGFDPLRVDDAASCSRAALSGWIDEIHASGAACSDGSEVAIWVVGRSGLRLADVVTARAQDDHAGDVVAVRAAEVARATLELPDGDEADAEVETPTLRPAPTWTTSPTTPARDAIERRRPPRVDPPRTPAIAFGMGVGAVLGADAKDPAVDFELEFRVARYLAIAARLDYPLQSTSIATSNGIFKIAPAIFASGLSFPLASAESRVVPRLGTGLGVVWLRSEATSFGASSFTDSQQTTITSGGTHRDDIFSPLVYVNAALSLRIAGPFRLVVDGLLGTTAHRMVVQDRNTAVAYFGQPLATLALRGELVF